MNPFLLPAAARPCPSPSSPWRRARRSGPANRPGSTPKTRALRRALGALVMMAGLGLAASPAYAVDLNQASAQQLEGVRGIGPRTAEIIVRERERGGKFESLDDLAERVRGIGAKKAQALQAAGLQVGEAGRPAAAAGTTPTPPAAAAKPAARPPAAPPSAARAPVRARP
ncbi:comE: comEA protein [compost metagenome]